jgi:low temperature requirement protein LtrA
VVRGQRRVGGGRWIHLRRDPGWALDRCDRSRPLGGAVGFNTPGLGRSTTEEWTISGSHFAERCQAFVLIALGESVVVISSTLSNLHSVTSAQVGAFVAAFAGAAALWWIYFDRSADAGAQMITDANDPGRLGRSAYHFIHPVMIAGIIVTAAAGERFLTDPQTTPKEFIRAPDD